MNGNDRHIETIDRAFKDLNNAILNLRTEANDEQTDALDVFQAGLAALQQTECHSVRMAFS